VGQTRCALAGAGRLRYRRASTAGDRGPRPRHPKAIKLKKPRIVVVGHLANAALFGAERSLLDILAAIDARTYDISCILPATNDDYIAAIRAYAADVTVFPYRWWDAARPHDPAAVARFEEYFRACGAALVHVNTITLTDPLLAARAVGVPSVVHARELVDQNEFLAAHLGGDPAAIVRTVLAAADFVIANSFATYRLFNKGPRTFLLYNCVDLDRFDMANAPEPGSLKVGMISNNSPDKGILNFVSLALACRRQAGLRFCVIGPRTAHVAAIEQALRDEGAGSTIEFQDYVPDPGEAIRQVNVVVSLSNVAESFGRTIAEAMAARRPVIACDRGAVPELVRHGIDGFVVPPIDIPKAASCLRILRTTPGLVAHMGESARGRAQELFSRARFAVELNRIYRQILVTTPA
jgi:glycosyltransferase involved in cell wall biosynthesis